MTRRICAYVETSRRMSFMRDILNIVADLFNTHTYARARGLLRSQRQSLLEYKRVRSDEHACVIVYQRVIYYTRTQHSARSDSMPFKQIHRGFCTKSSMERITRQFLSFSLKHQNNLAAEKNQSRLESGSFVSTVEFSRR